jgi:hypothetical protein
VVVTKRGSSTTPVLVGGFEAGYVWDATSTKGTTNPRTRRSLKVAELLIVEPVDPTNYSVSHFRVEFPGRGTGDNLVRTISIPDQSATPATQERVIILFVL